MKIVRADEEGARACCFHAHPNIASIKPHTTEARYCYLPPHLMRHPAVRCNQAARPDAVSPRAPGAIINCNLILGLIENAIFRSSRLHQPAVDQTTNALSILFIEGVCPTLMVPLLLPPHRFLDDIALEAIKLVFRVLGSCLLVSVRRFGGRECRGRRASFQRGS